MNKKDQIKYEADYIIHSNLTIDEASKKLSEVLNKNISKRTLQLHINNKLKELDIEKYNEVRKTIEKNAIKKMSKGGKESKRETNYSKTLILLIANEMITSYNNGHKFTLEKASKKYHIPMSTLYSLLKNDRIIDPNDQKKLKIVKDYNKRAK